MITIRIPWFRTFRDCCSSYVQFRVTKNGQKLAVVHICTEHNHPVSKVSDV